MGITVTEKERWNDSISKRIDSKIKAIKEQHAPIIKEIAARSGAQAVKNLGIKEDYEKLQKLEEEEKTAKKKAADLTEKIYAKIRPDDSSGSYYIRNHLISAISDTSREIQSKLMLEHDFGKQIAGLEREKENMLDTIWLATSPRQATKLWQGVLLLLGDEITKFQKEVLATKDKTSSK